MSDRTVLITGASRGIGRAAAVLAAQRGWSVGVNYVSDSDAANEVVAEISKSGGRAVALKGDVSREEDVIAMFANAESALGVIHAVVVNAGVVAPTAKLVEMTVERMRRVFDINTLGAYITAREAAKRLMKSRGGPGGSITFMSSAAARLGSPNLYVDYAGAKAAIDTLTKGLSIELGPEGVRVNCIRPGMIETDIHASGGDPRRAFTMGATAPLGRPGLPEEVAEAIAFLIDERASSYVTGAILDVSGGR